IVGARAQAALVRFAADLPERPPRLVVAGGVAANQAVGARLQQVAAEAGARLVVPPAALCTDNGARVARAGAERLARGVIDSLDFAARARWPLQSPDMGVPDAA